MKWSKWLTPEQLEQYRQQQRAKIEATDKWFESLPPEEKRRALNAIPPLPEKLPTGDFELRLRAEKLLDHEADGDLELSDADREELIRIAVAPGEDSDDKRFLSKDEAFLGEFDAFFEALDGEEPFHD
jgi:hypothetical protein